MFQFPTPESLPSPDVPLRLQLLLSSPGPVGARVLGVGAVMLVALVAVRGLVVGAGGAADGVAPGKGLLQGLSRNDSYIIRRL